MPSPPRQTKDLRTRKILFVVLLLVIAGAIAFSILQNRPWIVPESAREMKNPISPAAADLGTIRPIYRDKCAACHGYTGKGDGHDAALYDPKPPNFTSARHMSSLTDGELFYKLTEGRKPMPSFKKRLSDEQRWRMVLLIRTFSEPASSAPAGSEPTGP
ncbi:MAG TPA: cytochrome c [Candidatus Acidoferrum sp.]|nr:cytochrome c [Candidatus Acidoferrum sp.]